MNFLFTLVLIVCVINAFKCLKASGKRRWSYLYFLTSTTALELQILHVAYAH